MRGERRPGKGANTNLPLFDQSMREPLHLYRALLRTLRGNDGGRPLPAPLRSKIAWNLRQLFTFYAHAPPSAAHDLLEDGRACLRVLRWLRTLPQVRRGDPGRARARQRPPPAPPCTRRQPPAPPLPLPGAARLRCSAAAPHLAPLVPFAGARR